MGLGVREEPTRATALHSPIYVCVLCTNAILRSGEDIGNAGNFHCVLVNPSSLVKLVLTNN